MPTQAIKTNSAGDVSLVPNEASYVTQVRIYSPNTTGTVTGTLAFIDGTLSFPLAAFSVDAKQTVLVDLTLDLKANQTVTLALDAAPTTQLTCITTYR